MFRKIAFLALAIVTVATALSFVGAKSADAAPPVGCKTAPLQPQLTSPTESGDVSTRRVKLTWGQTTCAATYSVIIRQDSKQGRIIDGATGLTQTEFVTKRLAPGHRYFWVVKACNLHGCTKSAKSLFAIKQEKRSPITTLAGAQ